MCGGYESSLCKHLSKQHVGMMALRASHLCVVGVSHPYVNMQCPQVGGSSRSSPRIQCGLAMSHSYNNMTRYSY